ncbi:ATP-binding protein [Nocardia sp. NPDC051321]|uniref:ATP-binding protein n=1 Tax=Nocardia sp. NPDC051321 TaxID=3364323 RepID=UPI00379347E2
MTEWRSYVPIEGAVELPPDPRVSDAIGRNHSFETALADLIDNSIDASARNVVIRLIRSVDGPKSLYVMDDGLGMSPKQIDLAMTVGGRKDYGPDDLGHFGVGLKAASFSQAQCLTVISRSEGHPAVGRQWRLNEITNGSVCGIVPEEFAASELGTQFNLPELGTGTIIRWDEVSAFPTGADISRAEEFISRTINAACEHLGLVFHRFLSNRRLSISFEVYDAEQELRPTRIPVTPLNPFGYSRSARIDYPKEIKSTIPGKELLFRCHIWPGRSSLREFRLSGEPARFQGLYFYRRDRLLQFGGWDGIHTQHPRLQLARVEIDITDAPPGLFMMNAEKSKVVVGLEFSRICSTAESDDGTALNDYLAVAEQVYRKSQERKKSRRPMIHPGHGLPTLLRTAIEREIPPVPGDARIGIRWREFDNDMFFELERDTHTVWLNKRYRHKLLGGKRAGLNDLPLLKTLIYLLAANLFEGERFGPRDKDNIDMWQELLTIAVKAERQ